MTRGIEAMTEGRTETGDMTEATESMTAGETAETAGMSLTKSADMIAQTDEAGRSLAGEKDLGMRMGTTEAEMTIEAQAPPEQSLRGEEWKVAERRGRPILK